MKIIQMHKDFYGFSGNLGNIIASSHPFYKTGIHTYAKKMIHDILNEPQTQKHFQLLKRIQLEENRL